MLINIHNLRLVLDISYHHVYLNDTSTWYSWVQIKFVFSKRVVHVTTNSKTERITIFFVRTMMEQFTSMNLDLTNMKF